jgi:hypothetical protein
LLVYLEERIAHLLEQFDQNTQKFQQQLNSLKQASSLEAIVWASWLMALELAKQIIDSELARRAQLPTSWTKCPHCGTRLHSKGMRPRQIQTLVGVVHWQRRVGRCPKGCQDSQRAPLDIALGIKSYQQTSLELVRLSCLLAVFVPFETVTVIVRRFTSIQLNAQTIWNWVQVWGLHAMTHIQEEMAQLARGQEPTPETISSTLAEMPLVIGADGVMVPMRPHKGKPHGSIQWREVKVGILVRLGHHLNRKGKEIVRLHQRRLVAVLGDIDALQSCLMLEALRQEWQKAKTVVWISDGGKGFWRLYNQCFSLRAIAVLDFYHAAQNLWKAAAACLDGRTKKARQWFKLMRHKLRHGQSKQVISELAYAIDFRELPTSVLKTLTNVHDYLQKHHEHIKYQQFKDQGLPLGSGMVESACKWLIQQRFKGVGMRWSEDGFNHLLHLRLAWVNDRFDSLFSVSVKPSPNL